MLLYHMTSIEEIRYILNGDDSYEHWISLNPTVYYKDNKPYGLIALVEYDGILHIASTVYGVHNKFTLGMYKDIIKLNNTQKICILFENNSINTKEIASLLEKYEGHSMYIKDHVYWYNGKGVDNVKHA